LKRKKIENDLAVSNSGYYKGNGENESRGKNGSYIFMQLRSNIY
jgi:hypothetical protein